MAKGAKIVGIIAIVAVFAIVGVLVYDSPSESRTSNEDTTFEIFEPYWTKPIDNMKDKVVGNFAPSAPAP